MTLGHVSVFPLVDLLCHGLLLSEPPVLCSKNSSGHYGPGNVQLLMVPASQPPYRPSDLR